MEEVDNIIIHSLRSIGSDIDEDVVSLKQFSTELIVANVVRCLKVINNDLELPNSLPQGMSARFRVGASLANHIQDLGYTGDVGYQTFLYSNEADIRRIFMFLVEKLPKETAQTSEEPLGASALLQRSIAAAVAQRLSSPWSPRYLHPKGITWRGKPLTWQREGGCCRHDYHSVHLTKPDGLGDISRKIAKEVRVYYAQHLPVVTVQTLQHVDTAPSLLEANAAEVTALQEWETEWNQAAGLASKLSKQEFRERKRQKIRKMVGDRLRQDAQKREGGMEGSALRDLQQVMAGIGAHAKSSARTKGSRFMHSEKLIFAKDEEKTMAQIGVEVPTKDTEEELQRRREAEVGGLKEELAALVTLLEKLDTDMRKFAASRQQMEEEIAAHTRQMSDKEEAFRVKKRTLDLLPDAENNIAKLQGVVDGSAQRLVSLATQWEKVRAPLIEQYRQLRDLGSMKESEAQKKLEEIKAFRARMKEVVDEARNKEELQKQLQSEYERMTKDVNRSAYTRRIMEIVSNIKKQKQEIDKVLVDTRALQKEINSVTGKLDRTFTVTDELVFRDAKKDEGVKKAYRFLAALHENCEVLIKTVEETGVIMREIRDLEDQIETESKKKILANLEKITEDYQQMKKENAALMAKMKHK